MCHRRIGDGDLRHHRTILGLLGGDFGVGLGDCSGGCLKNKKDVQLREVCTFKRGRYNMNTATANTQHNG